jgi:hypothetical protein
MGAALEVIVTGHFNRHHLLWGGNEVIRQWKHQDEADPIIHYQIRSRTHSEGFSSLLRPSSLPFLPSPILGKSHFHCKVNPHTLVIIRMGLSRQQDGGQLARLDHSNDFAFFSVV